MTARSSFFGSCISAIPNLFVLATLIGIGYWGHTQHWKIPKFSDLMHGNLGSHASADSHATPVTKDATKSATAAGEHQATDGDSIPTIQFASGDALRKSGITVGQIQERSMDEFVHAYGSVTYDETRLAQLSCRVPGIVWRVEKQLGDTVKKGEILAIYDSNDVGRAKAEVLEADVKSDLANQTLERLTQVGDAVPARTVREAEAEVRMTAVRRFNAQQALLNLGLPISMQAMTGLSDADLADRLHFLGLPPEVVSSLDRETVSANLIPLISPLDGMVIRRDIVTGELADPDQPQFTVTDIRKMWLILNVRKEDATGLEIGQTVYFSSTGLPGEVESRLSWIATETDKRTRSVQVWAEIDNVASEDGAGKPTKWRFRAHMFGTGRIQIRQRPVALVVPNSAVQWDGTRHLIFSPQSDGRSFRAIPVKLGVIQDGYTEVLGDVARGQPVVSTGAYLLKSELMGVEN